MSWFALAVMSSSCALSSENNEQRYQRVSKHGSGVGAENSVDIAEQPLGSALMLLSSQTGINIIGLSSEMDSVMGSAVQGTMNSVEALDALLRGSGFEYKLISDYAVSIRAQQTVSTITSIEKSPELDEVVVTADRRYMNQQQSAVAVSHLSNEELDFNHLTDLRDISSWVPGLEFVSTGPQESVLVQLRGVGTTNITEIADGPVSIHIDGIYSPRSQGVASLFHDVGNLEVLRGPQGTLFGRNSSSGSINVYSRVPNLKSNEASVEFGLGNYQQRRTHVLANWALSPEFAIRFSGVTQKHDPFTEALSSYAGLGRHYPANNDVLEDFQQSSGSAPGVDAEDRYSWRVSGLWQPSQNVEWLFGLERYADRGSGSAELDPTLVDQGIRGVVLDTEPFVDLNNDVLRSRLSWSLSDSLSVTYLTGLAKMQRKQLYDTDQGRTGDYEVERTVSSNFNFLSHELLLKSESNNRLSWLAGLFASRERNDILFAVDQQNVGGARIASDVSSWISGLPGAGVFYANQPQRRSESLGAYTQFIFQVSELTRLSLGARYNRDTKSDIGGRNLNCRVPSSFGPYQSPLSLGSGAPNDSQTFADNRISRALASGTFIGGGTLLGIGDQPCWVVTVNDIEASWSNVSGLIRADHQLSTDTLLYSSVSSGFKAGHIQDAGNTAKPETVTSYELGFKSQFLSDRLRVNGAIYQADYRDLQFSDDDRVDTNSDGIPDAGGNTKVRNASNARVRGIELELRWKPSGAHEWRSSVALTNARFSRFDIPDSMFGNLFNPFSNPLEATNEDPVSLSGNTPPRVPDWKISLAYVYQRELSYGVLKVGGALSTSDEYFLDIYNRDNVAAGVFENLPRGGKGLGMQDAFSKLDLSVSLKSLKERWKIDLWVKNATNEAIKTRASSFITENGFIANYAPPRTYGVNIKYAYE